MPGVVVATPGQGEGKLAFALRARLPLGAKGNCLPAPGAPADGIPADATHGRLVAASMPAKKCVQVIANKRTTPRTGAGDHPRRLDFVRGMFCDPGTLDPWPVDATLRRPERLCAGQASGAAD
jgi:hypothetical protein